MKLHIAARLIYYSQLRPSGDILVYAVKTKR